MRRDKSNQVRVLLDMREDGGPLAVHRNHEKRDEGSKISSFIGILPVPHVTTHSHTQEEGGA
jgi:hypothetical protein